MSKGKWGNNKKILCGGDGLTAKRGMDAKLAKADGCTPEKRLKGIIMKTEDWHEAVLCMQVKIIQTNPLFLLLLNIIIL